MEWTKTKPVPPMERSEFRHGGRIHGSVSQSEDGRRYMYFSLYVSAFSEASHAECRSTWPREAIQRAREELDRFEASLDE